MNNFSFIGNIGSDAETRYTQSGTAVTSFSVAVSSGYGDNKTTTWVRCNLWGDRGPKLQPYLAKGKQVGVTGELSAREWSKDGVTKTSLEVRVQDVTLCGGKSDSPQRQAQPAAEQQAGGSFEDDIPFAPFDKGQFA